MNVIARGRLVDFWTAHPEAKASLERWHAVTSKATWQTTSDVQATFPKAKVLNAERVRFEVAGGNYRLVVAFHFEMQTVWVKFIGTHSEYDRIDALTVSMFGPRK